MTEDQNNHSNRRNTDRIPFETNVHIEFEKFSGFISEYSVNISEGGMFIKSDNPAPVGTILSFEFKLKDNFTLIQGLGEVSWIRDRATSPEDPAGMGVKFREVSNQSKQLISTMITNHINKGGKVFDLDSAMDKTKTLAFFDTGETAIEQSYVPESTQVNDKSNLEALFDVPPEPEEISFAPNAPTDSTKKDLEALFSLDSEEEAIISVPPKSKRSDPELREHTSPEMPTLQKESRRSFKGVGIILLGLLISLAAGAFFFKNELSSFLKDTPLAFMVAWNAPATLPEDSKVESPQEAPETKQTPLHQATPPHETTSAPLDAVIDSQPENQATPVPTATAVVTATTEPTTLAVVTPKETPVATPSPVVTEKAPVSGRATRITKVFYENIQNGLILSIVFNGKMGVQTYTHLSIVEGAPREVIKLTGLGEKWKQSKVAVSHPSIQQIRVGNHATSLGNEVHFVVDLKDPAFRISRVENANNMVQFYFEQKISK